jgi:hypothetical protein
MAPAGDHVGTWDVVTSVTKLHLQGFSARRPREQLVSKTDAENGCSGLVHCRLDVLHRFLHHGWVTRTVRDEQTIVLFARQTREVVVPWHDFDLDSSSQQTSQLVVFEANVYTYYTERATGRVF